MFATFVLSAAAHELVLAVVSHKTRYVDARLRVKCNSFTSGNGRIFAVCCIHLILIPGLVGESISGLLYS